MPDLLAVALCALGVFALVVGAAHRSRPWLGVAVVCALCALALSTGAARVVGLATLAAVVLGACVDAGRADS